jgi:hypothetical protein
LTTTVIGNIAYIEISEVALMGSDDRPYNGKYQKRGAMNTSPFLSVHDSCEKTLQLTTQRLHQAGFRSVQTFDLHTARLGSHVCQCPHHGTQACDCQMVVLLVYGAIAEPVTLILHGNDGQTWLSTPEGPASGSSLKEQIRQVLNADKLASND